MNARVQHVDLARCPTGISAHSKWDDGRRIRQSHELCEYDELLRVPTAHRRGLPRCALAVFTRSVGEGCRPPMMFSTMASGEATRAASGGSGLHHSARGCGLP